jgi:hypothetical protein
MQKETTYTPTPEMELLAQLLANGPVWDAVLESEIRKYETVELRA